MRRPAQPPLPPPDQPSTTRAVAWTAMFFSALSLLISVFLLFTCWDNGRLINNFRELWQDVKPAIDKFSEKNGVEVKWDRVRERVESIQEQITQGDKSAKFSIDSLRRDLDLMKDYTTERSSKWFAEMNESLAKARAEAEKNGPAAAARLKTLADQIKTRAAAEKAKPALPKDADQ
jgi:hypothetical protein